MPPHCDTLDGPVVITAKKALKKGNVNLILPWIPKEAERELKRAFKKTLRVRKLSKEATGLADYWFFETAVRLHKAGEGASYTGLKPAGLDPGPIVPRAEKAIKKGSPENLIEFITKAVKKELLKKFNNAMSKKKYDENNVKAARKYVTAMLGFILFSHHLYAFLTSDEEHKGKKKAGHEH